MKKTIHVTLNDICGGLANDFELDFHLKDRTSDKGMSFTIETLRTKNDEL